jgi:hypothetical protein
MNADEYLSWGVELRERWGKVHREIAEYCAVGVEARIAGDAASHLGAGVRENWVRRMAKVFELYASVPELIYPDIAVNVYETAAKADDPVHALKMAVDEKYRHQQGVGGNGTWSAAGLQDWMDGEKGKKTSRVQRLKGLARVAEWETQRSDDGKPTLRVVLDFEDRSDTTEPPEELKVTAWEVLK